MKRAEFEQQLHRIIVRLNQIFEEDRRIIQPRSSQPVTVPVAELLAYGQRFDEREALHKELQALGSEKIED